MGWLRRLFGDRLPDGFPGVLKDGENALAAAAVVGGGHLVVTELGIWIPESDRARRIGWHLVSKAAWSADIMTLIEAEVAGAAGQAVILRDRQPVRFRLINPGKLPQLVRQRVDGSIRARHRHELAHGGVWFIQRKIPGQDGTVLQARPDPGVNEDTVAAIAAQAAATLAQPSDWPNV